MLIFPLKHPFNVVQVATIFLNNIVNLHSLPKSIVSIEIRYSLAPFERPYFLL
jgi:hypothetical protein